MVTVTGQTVTSGLGIEKIKDDMSKLLKMSVYVGIPEENAPRAGEAVSNAQLAYLHTNGSELQNIPARPFLEPTIKANTEKIGKYMKEAGQLIANGDTEGGKLKLEDIGLQIATKTKDYFTDPNNGWAPNSLKTVARKGSDKPLIDTGSLRNSITSVVVEND